MKRTIFCTLLIFLLQSNFIFAGGGEIKGNGKITKESRNTATFTEISAGGIFDVVLTQGEQTTLQLEGEENILPYVKVIVKGDKLWISMNPDYEYKINREIKVSITLPKLRGIDASGASKFRSTNVFNNSDEFEMDGSGAAEISLQLVASNLEVDLSGASNVTLSGSAAHVEIHLSGASDFEGETFRTEETEVRTSGASSIDISASKTLDIEASGSSTVHYYGDAEITSTSSGTAKIKKIR